MDVSSQASKMTDGGPHAQEVPRPPYPSPEGAPRNARPQRQGSYSKAALRPHPAQSRCQRQRQLDRRENSRGFGGFQRHHSARAQALLRGGAGGGAYAKEARKAEKAKLGWAG